MSFLHQGFNQCWAFFLNRSSAARPVAALSQGFVAGSLALLFFAVEPAAALALTLLTLGCATTKPNYIALQPKAPPPPPAIPAPKSFGSVSRITAALPIPL